MTEHTNLASALAAFHADLPKVGKGSTNPAFKSKYADLADIVAVVLPALAKQGLAWIATPTFKDEVFVLAYELRHVAGETISGVWPLPDPTKAKPQELGSAVTYAKRYALSAVTGIAPDEDDDGNAASAKGANSAQTRVGNAIKAMSDATDLASLDAVWRRVEASGLAGVGEVKTAFAKRTTALAGTKKPEPVNEWEAAPVPD